jgi:glycosyltransferase involved in cell wall biosynthesis
MISLICTVYNREKYLLQCLQSVFDQTHGDWELIVWDDGSTDQSRAIADEFRDDKRIWIGGTESNNGRSLALRNAIYASQGEWFALLDSDDFLHTEAIAHLNRAVTDDTTAIIYTNRFEVDHRGALIMERRAYEPEVIRQRDYLGCYPFHLQCYRRALFDKTEGINTNLNLAVDFDLSLKMLEMGGLCHVDWPLYYHRIHRDRLSSDVDAQTMDAVKAARAAVKRRGLPITLSLGWNVNQSTRNAHPSH